MKTVRDRGQYQTLLSDDDRQVLGQIVALFGQFVGPELTPIGHYRTMTPEAVWLEIVSQVCVAGSARHWDRLYADPAASARFEKAISLQSLGRQKHPVSYIEETLRTFSVTRFHNRSAKRLASMLEFLTVFRDGKLVLLEGLSHEDDSDHIRDALMNRCPIFRLKSASNFMISVGLSHDVIALDSRIVGLLREHFDYNATAARIQSSRQLYLSLESALREFCHEQGVLLGRLDRLLFRFSRMSAIDLVVKYPQLTRYLGQQRAHNLGEQHGAGD
jgi:thermostable 8-oxoguanine DNA glycosylase